MRRGNWRDMTGRKTMALRKALRGKMCPGREQVIKKLNKERKKDEQQ